MLTAAGHKLNISQWHDAVSKQNKSDFGRNRFATFKSPEMIILLYMLLISPPV